MGPLTIGEDNGSGQVVVASCGQTTKSLEHAVYSPRAGLGRTFAEGKEHQSNNGSNDVALLSSLPLRGSSGAASLLGHLCPAR